MATRYIIGLIILLGASIQLAAQQDYDEKLRSLYKNTVVIITPTEVQQAIEKGEKLLLLDTRSPEEYKVSHLPGARFLDFNSYTRHDLEKIPTDTRIIVYCSVGYRSERIGEHLLKSGHKNVQNLYGGIFEWKNKGFSVVNKNNVVTDSVHTYNKNWSKWLIKGIRIY